MVSGVASGSAAAARYQAQSIPLLVLTLDGHEVGRLTGAVPAQRLRQWLEAQPAGASGGIAGVSWGRTGLPQRADRPPQTGTTGPAGGQPGDSSLCSRVPAGIWKLPRASRRPQSSVRGGAQMPTFRAIERDEQAISRWRRYQWPALKESPPGEERGSASPTNAAKR